MPVFRIHRNRDYTTMSNHHLRDKTISLKAKGLLSQMLSLPDEWDYTLAGLACINLESKDAIRTAVVELERAGYVRRYQTRGGNGIFASNIYDIYEQPQPPLTTPSPEEPLPENPTTDSPSPESTSPGYPSSENTTQLNKDQSNKEKSKKDLSSKDRFPSLLPPQPNRREAKRTQDNDLSAFRSLICENIEYSFLLEERPGDREMIDEIVDLMTETVCSRKETIRVSGNPYPAMVVRSRLLKLTGEHIRFVLDCMQENTTKVRNIRQYLLAVLFNAPSTISSYYSARVNHDLSQLGVIP